MIPAAHQNHVAVPSLQRAFGGVGCGVEMLERKSLWLADAVVVNLVEIDFHWRIMHVVFVGRIARPVSSGSVDLDDHQLVGGKSRRHDVHDLARRVSAPTQTADDVGRLDQSWLKLCCGRDSALRNFAGGFGGEGDSVSGGKVKGEREAVKNIFSFSDWLRPSAPVCLANPAQEHESCFFMVGATPPNIAGLKATNKETHPFPSRLFTR